MVQAKRRQLCYIGVNHVPAHYTNDTNNNLTKIVARNASGALTTEYVYDKDSRKTQTKAPVFRDRCTSFFIKRSLCEHYPIKTQEHES